MLTNFVQPFLAATSFNMANCQQRMELAPM
jgi:hypothetical protein